jgi:hypothetical protein
MATQFRKRFGKLGQWHFHPECLDWPLAEYLERTDLPSQEFLCVECVRLLETESDPEEN